jgi:hypothetical protein
MLRPPDRPEWAVPRPHPGIHCSGLAYVAHRGSELPSDHGSQPFSGSHTILSNVAFPYPARHRRLLLDSLNLLIEIGTELEIL